MGKRGSDQSVAGDLAGHGGDAGAAGKTKAFARAAAAGRGRRAGRKAKRSAAPKPQPARKPSGAGAPRSSKALAAQGREFARMNERRPPKRVKSGGGVEPPRDLERTTRSILRRVGRYALAPVALARALVDRLRDRD